MCIGLLAACGGGDSTPPPAVSVYQSPQTLGIDRLRRASQVPINISFDRGVPRTIRLDLPIPVFTNPEAAARQFLTDYADLLAQQSLIEDTDRRQLQFVTRYTSRMDAPEPADFVRFAQSYDGVEVFGAEIVVGVVQPVVGPARIVHSNGRFMAALQLDPLAVLF